MRLSWLLFALLVAMCLSVVYLFVTVEEVADGHGFAHPRFGTMQQGGDGARRHQPVLWVGWLWGSLVIAFFVGLLALGMRRQGRLEGRKWLLLGGFVLYAVVYACMLLAYHGYTGAGVRPLVLSFPIPSAWMLYGLWPIPLYFTLFYVLFYDRWVLRHEDLETFQQLVEARRQREAD